MDGAKKMEEGRLNSPLNDDANGDLKKQEINKVKNEDSIIEYDRETMVKPVGEPVQQIAEEDQQPLVKQKTKRVATLDAFRGLTIVVSVLQIFFFWYCFVLLS